MLSAAETREIQTRMAALKEAAANRIGPVCSATLSLYDDIRPDEWSVCVSFKTQRGAPGWTFSPSRLTGWGECPLSAIEAAHREIARRVLEENGEAA